jgi:hypothetical protein
MDSVGYRVADFLLGDMRMCRLNIWSYEGGSSTYCLEGYSQPHEDTAPSQRRYTHEG